MLKIYNIKDKIEYIEEVASLTQREWGSFSSDLEFRQKVNRKISKIKYNLDDKYYCKLILLDDDNLVGFISIFEFDDDTRKDLYPWYSTMFVKEEYRKRGYSKILNDAILKEAKKRNFKKLYLKTNLENYYEKFGAKYIEKLKDGEKLYCFEL